MKRGFPQKIEPLLPQSLGKDALDALMELATATSAGKSPSADVLNHIRCLRPEDIASVVQQAGGADWVNRYLAPILTNPDCQRRLQTSAAVVGLALSMGASDILSLMRNQALAAEASTTEFAASQRADELAAELQKLAESASSAVELGTLASADSFSPTAAPMVVSARPTSESLHRSDPDLTQTFAEAESSSSYHIVQTGETVFSLARSYGVSPAQIVSINRLDNGSGIKAGQTLQIPDSATRAATEPSVTSVTIAARPQTDEVQLSQLKPYQVRPGDTLDSIARGHDITRAEIVALNQLSNADELRVDQVIALPHTARSIGARAVQPAIANAPQKLAEQTSADVAVLPSEVALPETPQTLSAANPNSPALSSPVRSGEGPTLSSETSSYRVQAGDTLVKISRKTGSSLAELSRLNGITNPNFIFVGQSLKLPATAAAPVKQQVEQPVVVANQPAAAETRVGPESSRYVDNLMSEIRQMRQQMRNESKVAEQALPQPLVPTLAPDKTAPPNRTASQAPTQRTGTASQPSDRYLEGLKAELQELQSNSRAVAQSPDSGASQSIKVELPPVAGAAAGVRIQPPSEPQIVAAAPLGSQSYEPLAQSLLSRSVSPDLPPLLSDPFMPDGALNGYIWPAKGTFTSGFGWRWGRMHKGIDIAGPVGTPIVAAANGVVTYSAWSDGGYGNLVEITHQDGSVSLYAHNSRLLVREGQRVRQGQQIAEMGSTGFSTGPHLHFEIHAAGQGAVNPMSLLPSQ